MEKRRDVQVGVVVTLGIFLGVVGTVWLARGFGGSGNLVYAAVQEVGQLQSGASVRFRGVEVGRVESVVVADDGLAVVVGMTIQPELPLSDDAAVIFAPESMFGDWQAEIVSRADYPQREFLDLPETDYLAGATLPDMSRLTASADLIARNLQSISSRVDIAFTEETAENMRRAIENIEEISEGLSLVVSQQARSFEELASRLEGTAREVEVMVRTARGAFERVDTLITAELVSELVEDLRIVGRSAEEISGSTRESLSEIRDATRRFGSTLAGLERLVEQLEEGDGALARLIGDPEMGSEAAQALSDLRALLTDMKENPGRYVKISIF